MKPYWVTVCVVVIVLALIGFGEGDDSVSGADIEIVGLGDNCGDKSVCDDKSHLTCIKFQCHCNFAKGYALDGDGIKCVLAENSEELFDYDDEDNSSYQTESVESDEENKGTKWPEDENEWQLPENNTEMGIKNSENKDVEEGEEEDASDETSDHSDQEQKNNNNSTVVNTEQDNSVEQKVEGKVEQNDEPPVVPQNKIMPDQKDGNKHDDDDDSDDWFDDDDDEVSWEAHENDFMNCLQDEDCVSSKLGPMSICNKGEAKCECHDTEFAEKKHRKTIVINGTCILWREIDSECTKHEECDAVISGPAWCHIDKASDSGICTCRPFHVWDEDLKECLPIAMQGTMSSCLNDAQCSASEALGQFSRCSEVTGRCECMPALGLGAKRVIEFQDKCIEERELGDTCVMDQECQATLGASANCDPFTSSCSCQPGHFCNKLLVRPAMSGFTMVVLIALCVSVMLGSMACIAMKRRSTKAYAFIQEQNDV